MTQTPSSDPAPYCAAPAAAAPSDAFLHSAYSHCARIAAGLLATRGGLSPQLFIVGPPTHGDAAASSRIAQAGEQALAAFHADEASSQQLAPFIQEVLDVQHERGRALARQLGAPLMAVHACHALAPAGTSLQHGDGQQAVQRADGRTECLLITLHTPGHSASTWSPLGRDAQGALGVAIAPLGPLVPLGRLAPSQPVA